MSSSALLMDVHIILTGRLPVSNSSSESACGTDKLIVAVCDRLTEVLSHEDKSKSKDWKYLCRLFYSVEVKTNNFGSGVLSCTTSLYDLFLCGTLTFE